MIFTIQKQLITLLVVSVVFLFPFFSISHADAFKCMDNKGNTVFQDSECGNNKKETKIQINKLTNNSQCTSICDSARTICVADLGLGERNSSKGLFLCEQAKKACDTRCFNPNLGRELEVLTAIERSTYERQLRYEQSLRDDANYQKEREARAAKREQKRKQRHCHKYQKKLAKIRARWERKQRSGWKPADETYYRRRIENAQDEVTIECQ